MKKDAQNIQSNPNITNKHIFVCDVCGQERSGNKYSVLDENFNKQNGLNQCESCLEEGLDVD